jgi:apolipoprotein N-acyltransferase
VLRYLLAIGAGAVSGLLLALALPPGDQWWLGPICIAPVLAAVSGKGLIPGFIGGITVPIVTSWAVQSNLLYHYKTENPSDKWILVGCGFFGFLIAIVCCVASETKTQGWRRILLLGTLAVVLELALFPILPAHLALTQYRVPGMMVAASIGGIWLVSLMLWIANAVVADWLRMLGIWLKSKPSIIGETPRLTYETLLLVPICSFYILSSVSLPGTKGPTLTVAAIQTTLTDDKSLRKLNGEAGRKGAALAVWPEFSGIELAPYGDTTELKQLSAELGQPSFVTSFRDANKPKPHNVAALFSSGTESKNYYKRKLFGGEMNMHAAGLIPVTADWAGHPRVGLSICFDSCYPQMLKETSAQTGVGIVALPTIDPDSANCFVAAIHGAFTPFRAAENGVSIARADGIAFSMLVDNTGSIVAESRNQPDYVLVGSFPTERRWTLYSVLGDWVLYLSGAYCLFEIMRGLAAKRDKSRVQRS